MPPKTLSYKVADGLFLVRQQIPSNAQATAKPVETPTNHILMVDVSGSMWGETDKIKNQIKTKLPKMMKEGDTLSLAAFSGRGQVYRILTGEPVATLADLADVNERIDRWLKPIGLTGFKEPVEEIGKIVDEVSKQNKNPFSAMFLSDGCDNQWSRTDIIKAIEKTAPKLAAATVVSYGYYADLPLLTQMAEKWGGTLIVSDNFTKFSPILDAVVQKKVVGGKKIEVQVGGDLIGGFAFAFDDKELITFGVENGDKVFVPENLTEITYLSPTSVGTNQGDLATVAKAGSDEATIARAYASVSLFAIRAKPDVVLPFLKATGDVYFIEKFSTLFGKQKYSEYQEESKGAAFNPNQRLTKGYDPNKVPRDDAFTVLDFLRLLQSDDQNRVMLNHSSFRYNRIGRSRVDANTVLTDEEQAELDKLNEELTKAKKDLAKSKEISAKIAAITNKPQPLTFVEGDDGKSQGYTVDNLVFNEDRPNVSIQTRKEGTVDLSARLPDEYKGNKVGKVPEKFSTFCFRNYSIIKDGLVNVEVLPVTLSSQTKNAFTKAIGDGRMPASAVTEQDGVTLIRLSDLPVINRQMVKTASAKTLFEKHWELTKARAEQKVFNTYQKEHFPGKKSEGFSALYGEEAAKWLADQGITDYSGFNPKSVVAESTDVYKAKALEVKLKGYSSIPSLNDYKKQAAKGKFNGPGELMKSAVAEVEAFMKSDDYTKADNQSEVFKKWLEGKSKAATEKCRKALFDIAQIKFSVVVGQVWFTEFKSIDENTMELTLDGVKCAFAVEATEYDEKI